MGSIAGLLAEARASVPAAEARLLLRHVLGCTAAWLAGHPDDTLADERAAEFSALVARRAAGEPVAYLIGRREFYGRDFVVTPEVLIPRPETELLVELALEKLGSRNTANILDLGTGSGCLAVTLALALPTAQVTAVDASPAALVVAQGNAGRLGAAVDFIESDWYAALPPQRFDLIVANPPYVAAGDAHLREGDLRFEPVTALTDQADGLAAIRRILAGAPDWLQPGGWLLLEHGYDQANAVWKLLSEAGFTAIEQQRDLAGILRVSGGCRGNIPD